MLNEYLDEKLLAEEVGFDGIMLNEHHDTSFCMGSVMNVEASVLARITKKVKIALLGNPLPIVGNPLRLAEELAMIDMISGGRLVSGWVRGGGSEQFASNANPAFNREYFNEAHEVVIKAWTEPGPTRYEGKHFHYRFIDPWVLPVQKPHPPIWIPGLLSPETVEWCAEHRYPYVALATFLPPTVDLWDFYRDAAAKQGYQVGTENFGYLQKVYVAETEEKAHEIAKYDMFGGAGIGYSLFGQPQWMFPPGYNSKQATKRIARQFTGARCGAGQSLGDRRQRRYAVGAGNAPECLCRASRASLRHLGAGSHRRRIDAPEHLQTLSPASRNNSRSSAALPRACCPRFAKCWSACAPASSSFGRTTVRSRAKIGSTTSGCSAMKWCRRCARWARSWTSNRPLRCSRVRARCRPRASPNRSDRWSRSRG